MHRRSRGPHPGTVHEPADDQAAVRADDQAAVPVDEIRAPQLPGVYAWFLADQRSVPKLPGEIRQLLRIAEVLDVPQDQSNLRTEFYPLKFADATIVGWSLRKNGLIWRSVAMLDGSVG